MPGMISRFSCVRRRPDLAAAVLPAAKIVNISEDPYARLVRFRRNPFGLS